MTNTYKTSKDYERLVELMKEGQTIVCFADYNVNERVYRDVARARLYTNTFQISARGIGYVWAFDGKDFIQQCNELNITFIDPTYTSELEEALKLLEHIDYSKEV